MAESHLGLSSIASVPATLEESLRRTMVLGLPPNDVDKPTFYFERDVAWTDHDAADKPWDWTAAPTTDNTPAPVKPICAVEFFAPIGRSGSQFTEVGDHFASTVIVTLTPTDFATVQNTSYMKMGPSQTTFWFRYWKPQTALAGLSIYQATFQAEDTA